MNTVGDHRKDAFLFGEAQSRVVVTVSAGAVNDFKKVAGSTEITEIGKVTGGQVTVNGEAWGEIREWKDKYDTAIEKLLSKEKSIDALSMI